MSSDSDNEQISDSSSIESDSDVRLAAAARLKPSQEICSKLSLPEHLAAYLEDRELDRDIKPLECSEDLLENIFSNYVIVKNILSNLCWQDKVIAKNVCRLWNSVTKTLQNEQLYPVDFSAYPNYLPKQRKAELLISNEFYTEPLAVFIFCIALKPNVIGCEFLVSSPCLMPCGKEHSYIDIIYNQAIAPKDCLYVVKASNVSYMPAPESRTIENMIHKPKGNITSFCGLYIPKIPGVDFKVLNIHIETNIPLITVPELKKLTERYIVKGVIACLTDNFLLYVDDDRVDYMGFLQSVQPDIPFAFAGCLVEDTLNRDRDIAEMVNNINKGNEYISGNITTLGLFLIPKENENSEESAASKLNFEVCSHVIKSKVWSKENINEDIKQFSKRVPHFEQSVAIKFSCMGRQNKHEAEQTYFREYFPNTRIVGCFGNGELGVNHPCDKPSAPPVKRAKEIDQKYDKLHSYSTVFFYIGWGKVIKEAENAE